MTLRRSAIRRIRQFIQARQTTEAASRIEDPELLLQLAQEQMTVMHARNRERAVQAITQKNNLEHMVRETERKVAALHEKARFARDEGDEERASEIMREEESYRHTLDEARSHLEKAITASDQVKLAIRREEDRIRRKTAEMTALKTQWKLVQIERALMISLAQLSALGNEPATRERVGERHQLSREMAIEAVTQKNYLATLASETQQRAEYLRREADTARREGDEETENLLLRELEQQEGIRAATDAALARANTVTNRARVLLDEEAERVRSLHRLEVGKAQITQAYTKAQETSEPKERTFLQRNALLFVALGITVLLLLVLLVIIL